VNARTTITPFVLLADKNSTKVGPGFFGMTQYLTTLSDTTGHG
jgi:hypothetical protein